MLHEHGDLRQRTRDFARRVAQAYRALPLRDRVAQVWANSFSARAVRSGRITVKPSGAL